MAATRRLTECLEENMMLQGEQDVVAEQVSESESESESERERESETLKGGRVGGVGSIFVLLFSPPPLLHFLV